MKQGTKENRPNIILITIDSLRYDHLGCYGYHRNTSPNMDALASRGVKFTQAISSGSHTNTSFPTIMTSALPPLQDAEGRGILQRSVTLAEVLKKSGYHNAAFTPSGDLSRFYGYNRGFDVFHDNFRQSKTWRAWSWMRGIAKSAGESIAKAADKSSLLLNPISSRVLTRPIIIAEEITTKSLLWHKSHRGVFFLWLHYMDVHHPYVPEDEYLSQFYDQPVSRRKMNILWRKMLLKPHEISSAEREIIINLYDADIKYTDYIIGQLLDELENSMDNTVVILTADHGDEFGEHGRFGHETLYDGILRVPLIIAGPGIECGTVIRQQVSLIDLAPTIIDLVGIENHQSFKGESLLLTIEDQEDIAIGTISVYLYKRLWNRSIAYRIPGWKCIIFESLDGNDIIKEEIYDLRNDPGEMVNLHNQGNDEANTFELEAKKKIAQFKQLKVEENRDYEKQRVKAKLSKVGKP